MKFRIFNREKDRGQYDWVFDHFEDRRRVSASPYLWTRIHERLRENPDLIASIVLRRKLNRALNMAFPLILLAVVSSGILIGKELSDDFCSRIYHCPSGGRSVQQEIPLEPGFPDETAEIFSMSSYLNDFNGGGY